MNSMSKLKSRSFKSAAVSVISLLMALFCVFGLSRGYITTHGAFINTSNIFAFLWLALFAVMFWLALSGITFRDLVICGAFGAVFAAFTCVGAAFTVLGTIPFTEPVLYINILAMSFVMAGILRIIFIAAPHVKDWLCKYDAAKLLNKRLEKPDMRTFFIFFAGFVVLWIPAFLALFPGLLSYDGPIQIEQMYNHITNGAPYNAHHPVAHTMFIGMCVRIGSALFGSNAAGIAIYSVIQGLTVAGVLAYLGIFMLRHRVPKLLVIFSMLFLALNPMVQIFVFTTAKDVFFGAFFLLTLIFTVDLILDPDAFASRPALMVRYAAAVILMALMKKQGVYILVIAAPFLIWIGRKHMIKMCATLLAPIILLLCFFGPVSGALNITPGKSQEMLSVPVQQIIRVVNLDPDGVTDEQKDTIRRYIPEEVWGSYIPEISDPIKDSFNNDEFKKDKSSFVNVWLSLGLSHPGMYADAFAYLTDAYWYPSTETSHYWALLMDFYNLSVPVEQHTLLPGYYDYLMDVGQDLFGGTPLFSTCVSIFMPVWAVLLCIAVVFRQRKFTLLIPLGMMLAFIFSLLLGPVACIRYIFPLLIACPLLLTLPFIRAKRYYPSSKFLEIFRFAANGIICFMLDWCTMMLLMHFTSLPDWICIAAGFVLSTALNYIICVVWVFEGAGKQNLASQAVFIGSSIVGFGLTELLMHIFMMAIPASIAKIIVTAMVTVFNYIAKRFAIYKIKPRSK